MPVTANPKILIVGRTKKATEPPVTERSILAKFRRFDCPFDLTERNIKKLCLQNWGEGYYWVYSPGHAQRMKTYFKGRVETDRWGRLR